MVLITKYFWIHDKSAKNTAAPSVDDYTTATFEPQSLSSRMLPDRVLARFFAPKREKGQLVPSISGIIKAGDDHVYTSALFHNLRGQPLDLTLETIYDAFGHALRSRSMAERSSYPPPIARLLSSSSSTATQQSVRQGPSLRASKEGRYEFQSESKSATASSRRSLDLLEIGIGRSKSRSKRAAPELVTMVGALEGVTGGSQSVTKEWVHEVQHAQNLDGRTGITVTAAELAALSVILGCSPSLAQVTQGLERTNQQPVIDRRGAFGISISGLKVEKGKYHISLTHHTRNKAQLPARGSGYSTLFAKHMAFGSLPYSASKSGINSINITTDTLEALEKGTALQLQNSDPLTPASHFLLSLPSSRNTIFHTLAPASDVKAGAPDLLLDVISSLPFMGGLTPLASTPLIQTVHFVAAAGLPDGRLLQRLDALIEKVHRQAPHLHLFGPLYEPGNAGLLFRERERLGRLATGATEQDTAADKAARVGRYMTLIERLMALVPGMKPEQVLSAVKDGVRREMTRCYQDAIAAAHSNDGIHKRNSTLSSRSTRRSNRSSSSPPLSPHTSSTSSSTYQMPSIRSVSAPLSHTISISPSAELLTRSSLTNTTTTTHSSSSTFPMHNLGRHVEAILKQSLPLDIETVATVVRLVIVAWTLSVARVEQDEYDEYEDELSGKDEYILA
ncbi:hypothetical protein K504DRAFT_241817 [Pleomassaria siparia CBS 279.74]|uniref:Uncharacterized protein n=1 Tax=Pleomassaria siparia CBS 279.74 TaxID=1314801 RepID=A0A6G1KE77_9PLEO|nr:hypothetical protein K504DRAFT_241817 [Pleomassaria siparia CBS 279.74]